MAKPNRVWIELDHPKSEAEGDITAALASGMLRKLGYVVGDHASIFWHQKHRSYCVTIDEAGGFLELTDNGHWFNLDFLAKDAA